MADHQNLKFTTTLEINEDSYAANLFGLNAQENFIIAFGASLVENHIRDAYNTGGIDKDQRDRYIKDIQSLHEKLSKYARHRKAEEDYGK